MQLTGKGYDPTKTRINPDTGEEENVWMYTQGYKAYWDSRQDLEKVNDKRDMVWNAFTQDALDKNKFIETARFKASNYGDTVEEQADRIIQEFVNRYGYEPSRQEVGAALSGEVYTGAIPPKLLKTVHDPYTNKTFVYDADDPKSRTITGGKNLDKYFADHIDPKKKRAWYDPRKVTDLIDSLIYEEENPDPWSFLNATMYDSWYDKNNEPISAKGVLALDAYGYLKIDVFGFGTGNEFEEEMRRLNNIVSGHALQVTEAVSGWEQAGQVAGAIVAPGIQAAIPA